MIRDHNEPSETIAFSSCFARAKRTDQAPDHHSALRDYWLSVVHRNMTLAFHFMKNGRTIKLHARINTQSGSKFYWESAWGEADFEVYCILTDSWINLGQEEGFGDIARLITTWSIGPREHPNLETFCESQNTQAFCTNVIIGKIVGKCKFLILHKCDRWVLRYVPLKYDSSFENISESREII